jgi:ABC-type bacteriocin/lantibiotic exporter with double-glycine peptidase domain
MRNSFTKIYQILEAKEKRSLVYISLLLLIGMFLEIFGLGIVFPFVLSILNPEKITDFYFVNEVLLFFQISEKTTFTQILLAFLIIVYLVKTIFMIYLAYKQNKFISKLNINLSNRLYKTYLYQPLEFHFKNNSSGLIKNIQIEVSYFKSFCMSFITIAIELSLAIAIFLTLIFVETLGAFFVGIYFIFLSIIYYQTVKPVLLRWGKTRETVVKKVSKTLVEGLGAIRELILFGALQTYVSSFEQNNEKLMQINTKNGTFQQLPRLFLEFFAIIGIVIFIFFLLLKGENNDYIISTIGVFVAATFRLIPSVNRVLNAFQNIKFYTPSIDLIYKELFNNTSEMNIIEDQELDFNSRIEIQDLYFKYLKDEPSWNIESINLLINKGDFIGIKGSSGSGKSTLIDLLVGLNEPDKGNFLIDGKSKILNNPNWRKQIGYVSQNVVLIDDSILQNIALGKDLNKINFENINDVIVKAGLKEFIGTLNEGFNTIVGERGVQLSGGQRQRIGIARALFQNPKILLLDEATSSLDNETEKKIMNSITLLKGQLTIILVAHRLSTLNNCNSIYEIKDHKLKKVS